MKFWQALLGELDNLNNNGDFNSLLRFILNFDTTSNNFQKRSSMKSDKKLAESIRVLAEKGKKKKHLPMKKL
jgi:hypothetical protein